MPRRRPPASDQQIARSRKLDITRSRTKKCRTITRLRANDRDWKYTDWNFNNYNDTEILQSYTDNNNQVYEDNDWKKTNNKYYYYDDDDFYYHFDLHCPSDYSD